MVLSLAKHSLSKVIIESENQLKYSLRAEECPAANEGMSCCKNNKEDIDNYFDYSDRLVFWCLFGKRDDEQYLKKEIRFYSPYELLQIVQINKLLDNSKKNTRTIESTVKSNDNEDTFTWRWCCR